MCWTMSNKQNENSYLEMSWKRTNMSQAHAFHWAYHKNGSKDFFVLTQGESLKEIEQVVD